MRNGSVWAVALATGMGLAGCTGGGPPDLVRLSSDGPDEFSIVPNEPLVQPPTYAALPPPVPGGGSLADPEPLTDAVVALGGRPGAQAAVPARDRTVVAYAGRAGVAPEVRATLAAEDLTVRERGTPRVLERLFGVNTYDRVYRRQVLDQHAELERFRRAGVRTPAAPPEGID